ncbi:GNAT family N-acetyltransferase [Achromobacter sp. NPDC058515]|uniref:GNAT family N-acetyltransferase n=1 Tax=Achromobacter sp. NPDC058515 TaxID=3346533 RepID=UPI00364964DC
MDQLPHSLDNPIWTALSTEQAHLGLGNALACRYHPEVAPFAAMESETPQAWLALGRLLPSGHQVALLSPQPPSPPDSLRAQPVGVIHQMVATGPEPGGADDPDVIPLRHADANDMFDLAHKTKPGPFCKRTHEMGNYIGIRVGGRLIAMAGERMHPAGHVEISAVCVDDAWRGKGIAARLVQRLQRDIQQRGESPFLHVLSDNRNAIALYERLGFALRQTFFLSLIGLAEQGPDLA